MSKYRVTVCREVWGYIDVEASNSLEAQLKISNGENETEFVKTRYGENEGVYNAVLIDRMKRSVMEAEQRLRKE